MEGEEGMGREELSEEKEETGRVWSCRVCDGDDGISSSGKRASERSSKFDEAYRRHPRERLHTAYFIP